jgi:hypothetical protein
MTTPAEPRSLLSLSAPPQSKRALVEAMLAFNAALASAQEGRNLLESPRLPPLMAAREKITEWHREQRDKSQWTPLTPEELEALIADAVGDHNLYQEKLMDEEPSVGQLDPVTATHFTCYQCPSATRCLYTFDPYNTSGDCLAEK